MAVLSPPGYQQAGVYSALLDRMYVNTGPTQQSFPSATVTAKSGFWSGKLPTYSVVSGMDVAVGPCAGLIRNGFVSGGGEYAFANPTSTQVSLAGSSPTLNRYDIVGFYVQDNFYDASGFSRVTLAVVQGTESAGTPTDPAVPASFLSVFRAVVSAGSTTPVLQGLLTRTVAEGGLLQIGTDTERTSLGTPHFGYPILRTDQYGMLQIWNGTNWWTAPNPPYLHMRQTVAQSIPNNTFTSLVFDLAGEDLDNFGGHVSGGTASRYTCQRAGVYTLAGSYAPAVSAVGIRLTRWTLNGALLPGGGSTPVIGSTGGFAAVSLAKTIILRLNVGDYIELQALQNSGGALNTLVATENFSTMSALWIAP